MSTKNAILEYLKRLAAQDDEFIVHHVTILDHLVPSKEHTYLQEVNICVYKTDPVYDALGLNKMQNLLIPRFVATPKVIDPFYDGGTDLVMGKLFFDEEVGREIRALILDDEDMQNLDGYVVGKKVIRNPLKRLIRVCLVPDQVVAEMLYPTGKTLVND